MTIHIVAAVEPEYVAQTGTVERWSIELFNVAPTIADALISQPWKRWSG